MRNAKKEKKEHIDTRTIEDVRANEEDLRFTFMFLIMTTIIYFSVTTFWGLNFIAPDAAAYIIALIAAIVYMARGFRRISTNPDDKYTPKNLRLFRILLIITIVVFVLMFLPGNREFLIMDGQLTFQGAMIFILPFVTIMYVLYAHSVKVGKRENQEERDFDETVVKAEIERRDAKGSN